jgi:hypothetical protein
VVVVVIAINVDASPESSVGRDHTPVRHNWQGGNSKGWSFVAPVRQMLVPNSCKPVQKCNVEGGINDQTYLRRRRELHYFPISLD